MCLPITIGSTTGGLVIQTICAMKINPAAFLFSEHIDSLAASGIVLAKIWENSDVIAIDQLGGRISEVGSNGRYGGNQGRRQCDRRLTRLGIIFDIRQILVMCLAFI